MRGTLQMHIIMSACNTINKPFGCYFMTFCHFSMQSQVCFGEISSMYWVYLAWFCLGGRLKARPASGSLPWEALTPSLSSIPGPDCLLPYGSKGKMNIKIALHLGG